MRATQTLIWIALLATAGVHSHNVATLVEPRSACTSGCVDALQLVSFGDTNLTLEYYDAMSTSDYFVSSLALCTHHYCTDIQSAAGWNELSEYCMLYGTLPLRSLEECLALAPANPREVDTITEKGTVLNETILLSAHSHQAGLLTEVRHPTQRTRNLAIQLTITSRRKLGTKRLDLATACVTFLSHHDLQMSG